MHPFDRLPISLALLVLLAPGVVRAEGLPFETTLRLGDPPRPFRFAIAAEERELRIEVRGGRGSSSERRALGAPARGVRAESVPTAGGGAVVLLRVETEGEGRYAFLYTTDARGRPTLAHHARLDAPSAGEPAGVVSIEDRTGDGHPDVLVGYRTDRFELCGMEPTILDPRAIDPRTLTLRPVVLRRLGEETLAGAERVVASRRSPGPSGPPAVSILHPRGASSHVHPGEFGAFRPPVALFDGDPTTAWVEGRSGNGLWEFATATVSGGERWPIRALSIVVRPEGPSGSRVTPPGRIHLTTSDGRVITVQIPEGTSPGETLWVEPSPPLETRCLSLILEPGEGVPRRAHVGIAELRAYTALDFGEGVDGLVAELSARGPRAARAVDFLGQMGEPARVALEEAYGDMPSEERRRAVAAFALLARGSDAAMQSLGRAAGDDDEAVRGAAVEALVRLGPRGVPALREAAVRDASGESLMALARHHPVAGLSVSLTLLAEGGASDRPEVRLALRTALLRAAAEGSAEFRRFFESAPPPGALSAAALAAIGAGEAGRDLALEAMERGADPGAEFPARYRLALAAADPTVARGLPDAVRGFLSSQARGAEEWMMRRAALVALSAEPDAPADLLLRSLEDEYPRVRVAAIESARGRLSSDREWVTRVATLAREDSWPMVRAAALDALASVEVARPILLAALDDRSERVRAAAITGLAEARDESAWEAIEARLLDDDEWPVVTDAAIAYAHRLCLAGAVDALAAVLERARRPRPYEPDIHSAQLAAAALGAIGTEEALAILRAASEGPADDPLKAIALRALSRAEPCRGHP